MFKMSMRAAVLAAVAMGLSACGAPEVTPLSAETHEEEEGITGMTYDPDALSTLAIDPGETLQTVELAPVPVSQAFDRVNVRWEVITGGGDALLEVSPDASGQWFPVVADFEEFVPETGVTLFTGHADVTAGSESIQGRITFSRPEGDGASPQLVLLELEVFLFSQISEPGDDTPSTEPEEGDLPAGAAAFAAPAIVTREQWGARAPKCSGSVHTPYRMTFHHTVTPNGETGNAAKARMRAMQAFHIDGRGWCDIGYHFSVDAAGMIYRGRTTTSRTGSHVGGQNSGNIGISLMGTYDSVNPPQAQLDGLMNGFAWMADEWSIPVSSDRVRGHREWPGQSTGCPGAKTLAKKSSIISGVLDRLNGTPPPPPPPPANDIIVDNPSTSFLASGNWWTSTSQADRYGTNYRVRSVAATSDLAQWKAALETRDYEVFVWYSQGANRTTEAPYFVYHKNGTTKKLVNQQANGGRWVSLGTYSFNGGTVERVGLSCWTSGQYVVADAVKFVPR